MSVIVCVLISLSGCRAMVCDLSLLHFLVIITYFQIKFLLFSHGVKMNINTSIDHQINNNK